MPPLLPVNNAILAKHNKRIVEHQRRGRKTEAAVLSLIRPILITIPLESHLLYNQYNGRKRKSTRVTR